MIVQTNGILEDGEVKVKSMLKTMLRRVHWPLRPCLLLSLAVPVRFDQSANLYLVKRHGSRILNQRVVICG